mmetsp:Transcript_42319/g.95246  ORF Transcript_42319/g.95246 Transcript_42319/m.95246 type:complete len:342 (-) Transcript_42319:66-1091(-)
MVGNVPNQGCLVLGGGTFGDVQPGEMANSSSSTSSLLDTDDRDAFEWEVRDCTTAFWQHAVAGSCAGIMEHCMVYPIDTVKTRMQASHNQHGVLRTAKSVFRRYGIRGLFRGVTVIGAGCVPAHVGLFGTYELAKAHLIDVHSAEHQPTRAAACGALSAIVHDTILTPTDVVKQRLQLGGYSGAGDCYAKIWRLEGLSGFYRSLPTTLAMNVPYNGLLIAANESFKKIFHLRGTMRLVDAPWYFFTAGLSGAVASALTVPMDVVKTRLQTQGLDPGEVQVRQQVVLRYTGIWSTMQIIYGNEGLKGFFRGIGPRMMLAMPSAAVCWGTYETVSTLLRRLDR